MKRFNFLSVAIAMVLLVTAVSCTTMTGTQDDYYNGNQQTRAYGNRIYVEDPYRGTIVLEKDPWSGRYYEVSPYGSSYNNRYYSRGYDSYRRNNGYYYRGNNNSRQPQQPTEEQKKKYQENKNEARKKVLGN